MTTDPYMLAGIEAHHVESTEDPGWCANAGCGQGWPCVPKKMADEVRRLTARADALLDEVARVERRARASAGQIADLTTERDEARAEVERQREWSDDLAEALPDEYDGDEAQEALIERALRDGLAARAALDRVRDVRDALPAVKAAVRAWDYEEDDSPDCTHDVVEGSLCHECVAEVATRAFANHIAREAQ